MSANDNTAEQEQQDGLLPLVIGVTGHRDLKDEYYQKYRKEVFDFFQGLKQRYAHTPLVLLSPLAAGADQLVAEVAVELDEAYKQGKEEGVKVDLVVSMPMPRKLYEADFEIKQGTEAKLDAESQRKARKRFDQLLGKARRIIELPMAEPSRQIGGVQAGEPNRPLQYALVGAFVARQCQILLALWDGQPDQGVGGTAQIVQFRRTGKLPLDEGLRAAANEVPEPYGLKDDPLEAPETGLVYWVKTARRTSDWPEDPLNPKDELPPHEELLPAAYDKANPAQRHKYQEGLHRIFSHVDTFNKDVLRQLPSLQDQWKNNKNALLPPDKGASLPASLVGLDSAYANADTLANLFQSRSQRTLKVLLWLVFAAVIVFAVYAHLLAHAPVDLGPASLEHVDLLALVFYVVILIVADGCYVYVTWRDYQNRHQDYRTLAEGLRVQYYWHLAGLPLSAADHYLTKQKSELDWIRNAIRARGLLAEPGRWEEDSAKECERKERMRLIDRQWIAGQYQYYARASLRGRREDVYWRQAGTGFLVASVMTGFVEAAVVLLRASPAAPRLWYLTIPFILVMLVLIGCHARTRRKEAKENAEQDQEEYEQDQEQIEEKPELKPAKPIPLPPSVSLNAARGLGGGALVSLLCWGLSALLCHFARRPESEKCFPLWGLVETDPKDWLIVAMGVSAAIGALLHYYAQTRAFAEHHQQYKRIKEMFYRVYVRSEQALAQNQSGAAREYMHKLGCEALAEHGDWLLLHRERPMELPKVEVG